jgi:glycosyltransferase involved in cell wall biosynthesis
MKKKFTTAHVITGLYTGGAEMMLYNLLSRTNRERFSPLVISLMNRGTLSERIESLGIPVYTIDIKPGEVPNPKLVWRLLRTIGKLKPDLLQGWMYHGNTAAWLSNVFSSQKVPIVWDVQHSIAGLVHEKKMTQSLIKFGAKISESINQVVFASANSKAQHEALGYCTKNACIIPNGFDTNNFQPSPEARLKFRTELGLSSEAFLIGLICRFHPMKDHKNFLQAAAILQKNYPDVHFVLVGRDVDKNNKELLEWIKELKLFNTYLLGERSDIPVITAALDIASSSSAYGEAFPMIAGEAMSCCVPCVVTDVGDSGWAVADTGRVVSPRNPQALAKAWEELIVMGFESRNALGLAARARVLEYFSLDSVVSKFENLYEELLAQKLNASVSLETLKHQR